MLIRCATEKPSSDGLSISRRAAEFPARSVRLKKKTPPDPTLDGRPFKPISEGERFLPQVKSGHASGENVAPGPVSEGISPVGKA